jgi:transcriptional regulator with XRE-family HTH domain
VADLYVEFGRLLRAARGDQSLSQADLARMIGLSRASIANIEAGRQHVALDQLFDLAHAVGLEPHQLLPDTSTMHRSERVPGLDRELERQGLDPALRSVLSSIMSRALSKEANGSPSR